MEYREETGLPVTAAPAPPFITSTSGFGNTEKRGAGVGFSLTAAATGPPDEGDEDMTPRLVTWDSLDDVDTAACALFKLPMAAVMMETGSLPDKRISQACS